MNDLWMLDIMLVIFAIWFLALGLRGIVTSRPFLLPASQLIWVMWILPIGLLPMLVPARELFFNLRSNTLGVAGIFSLLVFVLVFGMLFLLLWRERDAYWAFGVTDESFQQALHSALSRLDLPFEESFSRLKLTSVGADLQAGIQSSMGAGELRIEQPQHRSTLKSIADAMNEYFKTEPCKVNITGSIYSCIMGVLMIAPVIIRAVISR
jgi:hypothetical protein